MLVDSKELEGMRWNCVGIYQFLGVGLRFLRLLSYRVEAEWGIESYVGKPAGARIRSM